MQSTVNKLSLVIGNYGQNDHYEDSHIPQPQIDESMLIAMQQHMAQQAAFSQIPDVVKGLIVHFHQPVLENNLAELIAPLINDDSIFLVLYRELCYRHVYSRLQLNLDDRFHSYENSCKLFNYLLNSEGPCTGDLFDVCGCEAYTVGRLEGFKSLLNISSRKHVVRGGVTNGHQWIFLILKLYEDGNGGKFFQSHAINLFMDDEGGICRLRTSLITAIIAHWIQHSHEEFSDDISDFFMQE
ncbi:uncharacterized protein LACBIDRAFT_319156 [Laccaria bicolor S238N-H82]|uniref:Predicted protein n=1 Tax=Laccaria bicolor (strain S238N-H82 / ATCC MYA-4686) TaxID=486041 RepID=B0D800_LACBS|nr:uncharacterized protein LACBIDRAFT_319156 [Laccaria bicolor S238N-H82]EDR09730.1 predicted protein [Laccaria bicolor S238N-H82]|eukprot:XP_001880079.1 predicted protein [Laccaria bicolor S238N-H82]